MAMPAGNRLIRKKIYSVADLECFTMVLNLESFKGKNNCLALGLQSTSLPLQHFRVVHVASKDNMGEDLVSRVDF